MSVPSLLHNKYVLILPTPPSFSKKIYTYKCWKIERIADFYFYLNKYNLSTVYNTQSRHELSLNSLNDISGMQLNVLVHVFSPFVLKKNNKNDKECNRLLVRNFSFQQIYHWRILRNQNQKERWNQMHWTLFKLQKYFLWIIHHRKNLLNNWIFF